MWGGVCVGAEWVGRRWLVRDGKSPHEHPRILLRHRLQRYNNTTRVASKKGFFLKWLVNFRVIGFDLDSFALQHCKGYLFLSCRELKCLYCNLYYGDVSQQT